MSKHGNHDAGFKARVALDAVKAERTVTELAAEYGGHPTMIHQWKRALLEGASDIFERGRKKTAEVDEDSVLAPPRCIFIQITAGPVQIATARSAQG